MATEIFFVDARCGEQKSRFVRQIQQLQRHFLEPPFKIVSLLALRPLFLDLSSFKQPFMALSRKALSPKQSFSGLPRIDILSIRRGPNIDNRIDLHNFQFGADLTETQLIILFQQRRST